MSSKYAAVKIMQSQKGKPEINIFQRIYIFKRFQWPPETYINKKDWQQQEFYLWISIHHKSMVTTNS